MTDEQKHLVEDNISLAYSVANKYAKYVSSIFEYDDVVGICFESLVNASLLFNKDKNIKFSTYAYNAMKNNLLKRYNLRKNKNRQFIFLSLDDVYTENDKTLGEVIANDVNIEEMIVNSDEIYLLYEYISFLSDEHQKILYLRLDGYTFDNISKVLNKNCVYVYKQYQKAINELRDKFKGK